MCNIDLLWLGLSAYAASVSNAKLFLRKIDNLPDQRLHPLAICFVNREILVARRAESIEDARFLDGFHPVRNIAREIKGIAGPKLVRRSIDNQFHPAFKNVDDLFLRMSMFRHLAANIQMSNHLVHCFAA
jgi:hypothetical protein